MDKQKRRRVFSIIIAIVIIIVLIPNLSNDGSIVLTNPNSINTLNYTIEERNTNRVLSTLDNLLCEVKYSDIDGSNPFVATFIGHISSDIIEIKPGTYTGTMQYEVRIEPCA